MRLFHVVFKHCILPSSLTSFMVATFMSANLFIKSPVSSDLPLKNSAWEMVAPTEISFF